MKLDPGKPGLCNNTLDELNGLILERTDFRLDKFPQITTDSLKAIHTKKSEINVMILLNVKIKLMIFIVLLPTSAAVLSWMWSNAVLY